MENEAFVKTLADTIVNKTEHESYTTYIVGERSMNLFKHSTAPVFNIGDFVEVTYREVEKNGKKYVNMLGGKVVKKTTEQEVKVTKNQFGVDQYDLTQNGKKEPECEEGSVKTSKPIATHPLQTAKKIKENSSKVYNLGMAKNGASSLIGQMLLAKYTKISSEFVAEYEDLKGATFIEKYKTLVRELMDANTKLSEEFID
jgi:hypothetical protein